MNPTKALRQAFRPLVVAFLLVPCWAQTPAETATNQSQLVTQRLQKLASPVTHPVTVETQPSQDWKIRLKQDMESRPGQFGNSWVDQAPKTWPIPMVTNPQRPVLPGSAW